MKINYLFKTCNILADFETTHISQLGPSKQNESMLIQNKENLNDKLELSIGEECESTYTYDGIV